MTRRFPTALRVEAKFTTGRSITIPKRELDALLSKERDVVGIVAALFWSGKRSVDGRWFIVDAAESFRSGAANGGSLEVQDLRRIERSQNWLAGVRQHVEHTWPPFLRAFYDAAIAGHEALCGELEESRKGGRLQQRLVTDPVLELEHRERLRAIIDSHGASVAGHVFQDLLAYLLTLAGYGRVQINPIGVPDIELSDLSSDVKTDLVELALTRPQAERLLELCCAAGETELANVLARESKAR